MFQISARFILNILVGKKEEKITKTKKIEDNDTIVLYTSARVWKDNYGNDFNGDLSVRELDYLRLKDHVNTYKSPSNGYFWGNLYDYLERTDSPSLDLVLDTFKAINKEHKLNQMEFAEMVVSCIQDIPYSFVLQETCPVAN